MLRFGVPGCWANVFGSRAPRDTLKVSISNMNLLTFNLQQILPLDTGLWSIGKVFADSDFVKLQQEVIATPDSLYQISPASQLRFELLWQLDGILEIVTESFKQVAPQVSEIIGFNVSCNQVRAWKDLPGYRIPMHEDDDSVTAHMQVYISSNDLGVGTTWYTPNGQHILPFVANSGYLTVCNYRYPHGMLLPVTKENRLSLYATFR